VSNGTLNSTHSLTRFQPHTRRYLITLSTGEQYDQHDIAIDHAGPFVNNTHMRHDVQDNNEMAFTTRSWNVPHTGT